MEKVGLIGSITGRNGSGELHCFTFSSQRYIRLIQGHAGNIDSFIQSSGNRHNNSSAAHLEGGTDSAAQTQDNGNIGPVGVDPAVDVIVIVMEFADKSIDTVNNTDILKVLCGLCCCRFLCKDTVAGTFSLIDAVEIVSGVLAACRQQLLGFRIREMVLIHLLQCNIEILMGYEIITLRTVHKRIVPGYIGEKALAVDIQHGPGMAFQNTLRVVGLAGNGMCLNTDCLQKKLVGIRIACANSDTIKQCAVCSLMLTLLFILHVLYDVVVKIQCFFRIRLI